jgi:chemotaxis signal transduction protein
MKKMLLFQVGKRPYGIDLLRVKSIQSVKHNVDERAEGGNQLRRVFDDEQRPLYDLMPILEKGTVNRDLENEKLIVVKTEEQSIGMIVSRVDQVISVDNDKIEALSPIFKGVSRSCFPRVLKHGDTLILILAPEGLEKAVQETADAQNVTTMSGCEDASPNEEEPVILVNEVSTMSDQVAMSLVNRHSPEPGIYEALPPEDNPKVRRSSEELEIAGAGFEIIDVAGIDDESQLESTSFLTNLLQKNSSDSSEEEPTGLIEVYDERSKKCET